MTTPDFADMTPPDELVRKWCRWHIDHDSPDILWRYIATQATRWGAQQGYQRGADDELEACCTWLDDHGYLAASPNLRAAMRPVPSSSLKHRALEDFNLLMSELDGAGNYSNCADRLRRALALIPEDTTNA